MPTEQSVAALEVFFEAAKRAGLSSNNSPASRQHDVEARSQTALPGSWRRQGKEGEEGRGRAGTFPGGFLWGKQHVRPSLCQPHYSRDAGRVAWSNQVGVADASASHPEFARYPSTSLLLSQCPPAPVQDALTRFPGKVPSYQARCPQDQPCPRHPHFQVSLRDLKLFRQEIYQAGCAKSF